MSVSTHLANFSLRGAEVSTRQEQHEVPRNLRSLSAKGSQSAKCSISRSTAARILGSMAESGPLDGGSGPAGGFLQRRTRTTTKTNPTISAIPGRIQTVRLNPVAG